MRRLLLISNLPDGESESACDGIFLQSMGGAFHVDWLRWSRDIRRPVRSGNHIAMPYARRRRGLVAALETVTDLAAYDVVVVRNQYSVLSQLLEGRRPGQAVGFWESFPHDFRRVEEAERTGRALGRKRLEYRVKKVWHDRLLARCDFFLPITQHHLEVFHPDLTIPCHPTGMGVADAATGLVRRGAENDGPVRFVYIGVMSMLRRIDEVVQAFARQDADFVLDIYSKDDNEATQMVMALQDPRIRFHGGLPRPELFARLADSDVGVCFFPHTKTFITASPTKAVEYGALGLTMICNEMPDYAGLFDAENVYFADFHVDAVAERIKEIIATPRVELRRRGRLCQDAVLAQRRYSVMASELIHFLDSLTVTGAPRPTVLASAPPIRQP